MKTKHILTAVLTMFASCLGLSAQTETMYERGATYLENTMPPSPEPASVVKYADVPFTHSTGMAEYDVPFYTLQGRELSIPIGLHYASGGIKLDEIAGVAGLGWTLQAGGCITRTVMDMPDEYVPTAGSFHHEMPSGSLLDDLEGMVETNATMNFLRDVVWNRVDVSLDRYSYSVCGLSGSFVIRDDGTVFQLSGDGVLIDYTRDSESGSVDVFTVTGPDGTVYTFSVKEMASRDGRGIEPIGPMNGKLDEWIAPTAWHLTSMRSRSGLETAEFTYSEPATWNRSVRSRSETMFISSENRYMNAQGSISMSNAESIYRPRVLTNISLNGISVSFSYLQGTGSISRTSAALLQQNFPFRLTGMEVHVAGSDDALYRMDVGTARDMHDGRIVLNSLELYRDGVLDDSWDFTYKGVGRTISVGSQDWYGYYNGENEFSEEGNDIICPYEADYGLNSFKLTNGFPSAEHASYMSLMSVDNDDAVTKFAYEGNVIDSPARTVSVGVRVSSITLPAAGELKPVRVRYFTYEDPFAYGPVEPSLDMYATSSMDMRRVDSITFYDWSYVLHATPVALGPSIQDTRIYYGKVTEDATDLLLIRNDAAASFHDTSRTVYEYSMDHVRPHVESCLGRFPEYSRTFYDGEYAPSGIGPLCGIRQYYVDSGQPSLPVLKRREDYAYEAGAYRLIASADYEYNEISRTSILVDYHATHVVQHWLDGFMTQDYIYHFPVYASSCSGRQPVKEVRVGYHASGNDTTVVNTSYVLRLSLEDPVRVSSVTMTAGNVERQMSYGYADQEAPSSDWTSTLESQHCLSVPVRKGISYTESESSAISGDIAMPTALPAFPDTVVHVDTPLIPPATPFREEITRYGWFDVLGGQVLLPSAHIEKTLGVESWREDVLTRDSRGAVTSVKEKGSPQTVILWGYGRRLPVAVIGNASMSEVQTAFGDRPSVMDALAGAPIPTQAYLDRIAALRAMLPQAHVTTYTHIPGKGVESVTDPAGMKTTFEYDHAGRLTCIRDNDGNKVEEYHYSLMADENKRRHMRSRVFRSTDGHQFSEDVRWWDVYGRTLQDISIDASGNGDDLVTAYGSDFMFHDDVKTWLPYPVQNSAGAFQTSAESAAADYHANERAYSFKNYEISSRDRVVSTALPGYAGEHESIFDADVLTRGSYHVISPIYMWNDNHVDTVGFYDSDELVVEKTTDADGRVTKICKDLFGKTIRTSVGSSGDTRYVYDLYDRLRAVMGSGIEVSDTLNMWRYDYDSLGRVSSKGIPGSVREHYTYDDEDRVIAVLRDGVLKEMEYDAMGRTVRVWQTLPGGQRTLLEDNMYDVYPSGISGADPKGLKTVSHIAEFGPDGSVTGYSDVLYQYDSRKRPVKVTTHYSDGTLLVEDMEYTFSGEVKSTVSSLRHDGQTDTLAVEWSYDRRGRLTDETASLTHSGSEPQVVRSIHRYDDLGRHAGTSSSMRNSPELTSLRSYTLQGWNYDLTVSLEDIPVFLQRLGYDAPSDFAGHVPQYSGMVSLKRERWPQPSEPQPYSWECYAYDHAGRLAKSISQGNISEYTYDPRGNILSETLPDTAGLFNYIYDGESDRLFSLITSTTAQQDTVTFTHDALGRMTFDGTTGQSITYNSLDLVGNIAKDATTLVNYSYLADGTKLSATDGSGEGLVYRGPFVYRRSSGSNAGSSLTLESAAFGGGRLTPDGALLYVRDYLGSVRAVVDGKTGDLYKASEYSAFGDEEQVMIAGQGSTPAHALATAALPTGLTLRDAYTGKEAQNPDFSTGYTDFGARQYSPTLRRWMTPDPLSEKYYGVSPYAFCNNNPVNFVDPDGEFPLLSNIVGGFVSAGVEYGSQVIGNVFSDGFSADAFTDVDLFDIGVAFGEGFITSGTNVARKIVTKSAIGLAGEVARNALDVEFKNGEVQTPVLNSFGEVLTDTVIGVASEAISVDVNITPFKGVSNTQAVRAARETAGARGASLSSEAADGIRKSNTAINAQKYAANQVVSEGVGSVPGSVAGEVLKRLNDEDQY